MSSLFLVLFMLSLVGLTWGLIAPHHIARITPIKRELTRMHTGISFTLIALVLFILVGATAPTPQQTLSVSQTSLKSDSTQQTKSGSDTSKTQAQTKQHTPTGTTKQETETQPVPYTTQNQNDSSLAKGQTKVLQQGKDGTETLTYTITYTNGTQTNKTLASTVVTAQPVAQIVEVGTYVAPAPKPAPIPAPVPKPAPVGCTSGTYVNSVGNIVCSPEAALTAPAGATAQCVDGTYSFSQSHSGTCSHHGGVAAWL